MANINFLNPHKYTPLVRPYKKRLRFFFIVLFAFSWALYQFNGITFLEMSSDEANGDNFIPKTNQIDKPYLIFSNWTTPFPCYHVNSTETQESNPKGVLYVKTFKAASSTLAGVATHMGERHRSSSLKKNEKCHVNAHHASAKDLGYANRDKTKSFLWTFLRDPKQRALSHYFFFPISLRKQNPSGKSMLEFLKGQKNFQAKYISTLAIPEKNVNGTKNQNMNVNKTAIKILQEYNFVGLVEMLDESLVVMRLLLDLDPKDIIYLPSKQMGAYALGSYDGECSHIYKKFTTPKVDEFLGSEEWEKDNELDYALVEVTKRSIFATIQTIGEETFQNALKEHKALLQQAKDTCINEFTYPCTEEGERIPNQKTSCYWNDIGCGHECIDNL